MIIFWIIIIRINNNNDSLKNNFFKFLLFSLLSLFLKEKFIQKRKKDNYCLYYDNNVIFFCFSFIHLVRVPFYPVIIYLYCVTVSYFRKRSYLIYNFLRFNKKNNFWFFFLFVLHLNWSLMKWYLWPFFPYSTIDLWFHF